MGAGSPGVGSILAWSSGCMVSAGVGVGFGGRGNAVSGIGKRRKRSLKWVLGLGCSFVGQRREVGHLGCPMSKGWRGTIRR